MTNLCTIDLPHTLQNHQYQHNFEYNRNIINFKDYLT